MLQMTFRRNPNWQNGEKINESKSQSLVKLDFKWNKSKKCHFDWQGFGS
jgi:hypothetical protein